MIDPIRDRLEAYTHTAYPKIFIGDQVFYNNQSYYIRDLDLSQNIAKIFNPRTTLIETALIKDLQK